jgi:hypothetical protein
VLNWLSRYAFVIAGRRRRSRPILDVGSGPYGVGFWTGEPFVGVDLTFEGPPHPLNFALRADAGALPFPDGAFESVILADLLEHVPPDRRPGVLEEALRVAARRVYITFPTGESARRADAAFGRWHRTVFGTVPPWVEEHGAFPLPEPGEVEALLRRGAEALNLKVRLKRVPGENVLFHLILTVFDHLPGVGREAVEAARSELKAWIRLCRQAAVGTPYRVNLMVELVGRPGPILKALAAEPDLFKVLACPACRRGLIPGPEALRCAYCGVAYVRNGALWDLRPVAGHGRRSLPLHGGAVELKEYLGPEFDPDLFRDVAAKVDAEFAGFSDPAEFYRRSRTYLYDLTLLLGALRGDSPPVPGAGEPLWLDGRAAAEYEEVFYLLFKLGRAEELDRVFPLAAWVWPEDEGRAQALARLAGQAGRWEVAAALLEPLKAAGKATAEDLSLLSAAYLECGLVEAALKEVPGETP